MNKVIKEFKKDLEQIETSEASGGAIYTIPPEYFHTGNRWVAERKLDGTRLKFHITSEGNRFDTRRISERSNKFMERSNNFPHLRDLDLPEFEGTILDGEGIAPVMEDTMGETQSIVGAGPEHAWDRQLGYTDEKTKKFIPGIGLLRYKAFDIIKYRGEDMRNLPFEVRRARLEDIIDTIIEKYPQCTIDLLEQMTMNKLELYQNEIKQGKEGIMLKDLDAVYGDIHGLVKVKKHIRLTMIITGFKPGAGKHLGKVGSVGIGFYNEKQLTFAGGLSDVLRQDMQDNPKDYLGQVIEIEAQEFTTTGALRHPRVVGTSEDRDSEDIRREKDRIFRTDKRPENCGRNQNIKVA